MQSGLLVWSTLAQAEAPAASSPWFMAGPLVIMMAIFYFMMIRPQQRKEKERLRMIAELRAGQKIELRGFGSFKLRQRGARVARNPKKSGVKVHVPPKLVPYFKPGKKLKELINEETPASEAAAAAPSAPREG